MRLLLVAVVTTLMASIGSFGTALADNEIVSSSPGDSASVAQSPDTIVINFAEEVGETNSIALTCGVEEVPLPNPEVLDGDLSISVDIAEPLPQGTCTIRWTVSNTDDEPNGNGIISFLVENGPPADAGAVDGSTVPVTTLTPVDDGAATAADASTTADADDEVVDLTIAGQGDASVWLGRLISTLGIATLFGSLLIITAAWPEGVEYLITIKFIRTVWVIAMIGTLLFVATASAAVTPNGGGSGFSPSTWLDLIDAGWAGRAALLRLILLTAAAWAAFRPDRAIDPTTQLAALGIPGLAAALLGVSRTMGDLAILGALVGIVHALAMSVWVGGVLLLARVVLSGPGDEDLVHAVRGFGRVSTPAIAITIITGVIQMIRLDGGELFSTGHGRVVVLKAVVIAFMIFVAISARQFVAQRLNRAQNMTVPLADRLRRAFGAEAGIGVVTLALSAWLLAFVPPNIDTTPSIGYDVSQTHTIDVADFEATVKFTDDQIGLVGLEVQVRRPDEGISDLVLILTAPPNDQNLGAIRQPIPLPGRGTATRAEAIGLPLSIAGDWTVELSAVSPAGPVSSAPIVFTVLDADGNPATTVVTSPAVSIVEAPAETLPADG